jgi:hydroxyversicolorone monooxygenase
LPSN